MNVASKFEDAIEEIKQLSEKSHALVTKTRKLIANLESETKSVQRHMDKIKKILGFEEKTCPVCSGRPDHCIEKCHHLFCKTCASRMLNHPPRQCYVCRSPVLAMFKIFPV